MKKEKEEEKGKEEAEEGDVDVLYQGQTTSERTCLRQPGLRILLNLWIFARLMDES